MNITTPIPSAVPSVTTSCLTTTIPANISADDFNVSHCETTTVGITDDDDGIVVFFSFGHRIAYAFILCVIAVIGKKRLT